MKTQKWGVVIMLLMQSCNPVEPDSQQWVPEELIGQWKTVAVFDSDGSNEPRWRDYQSDKTYDIWYKENGEYASFDFTYNDQCNDGTYSVNKKYEITFYTPCAGIYIVQIDSLFGDTLIIDANHFEFIKTKSFRVGIK